MLTKDIKIILIDVNHLIDSFIYEVLLYDIG